MRKTKIVATIGPASENLPVLREIIKSGLNVARLNFSHGDFAEHGMRITSIRKLEEELNVKIRIMQDLCGPKLRLGDFDEKMVTEGETVVFGNNGIPVQKEIWKWFSKGQIILIDDGVVELVTTAVQSDGFEAKVTVPGKIKMRKGVSLPGIKVDLPSLLDKDIADLEFGIQAGVDAVALSFVKTAEDIEDLRTRIGKLTNRQVSIVAKIETIEALENIESIITASDVIMVARGDLALNVDQDSVPLYQKTIVNLCRKLGKSVIVATQMLDSMTNNPRPTRAEVSDVSNAVIDGANAVMLSGETAFGKYPIQTVKTMADIIEKTEISETYKQASRKNELIKA